MRDRAIWQETIDDLRSHERAARLLAASAVTKTLAGAEPPTPEDAAAQLRDHERCTAKASTYGHAAQLLEDALTRTEALTAAERDVLAERAKQREKCGNAHDDEHGNGALPAAAALIAHPGVYLPTDCGCREAFCPHLTFREPETFGIPAPDWAVGLWRKHDRRGRLVVGAALLLAEVERIDRTSARKGA